MNFYVLDAAEKRGELLAKSNMDFVAVDVNLVDVLWENKPDVPTEEVYNN
jgi:hypothetical protein